MIDFQSRAASVKDSALQREAADLNSELMKLLDRRKREPLGVNRINDGEKMVQNTRDHIVTFVRVSPEKGNLFSFLFALF